MFVFGVTTTKKFQVEGGRAVATRAESAMEDTERGAFQSRNESRVFFISFFISLD